MSTRICPQCERKTPEEVCPHDGFPTVEAARYARKKDPYLGTEFVGRYRVESLIGRGGMGAVYKATQTAVGRPVALKVLKTDLVDDLKEVARFQQEARSIAQLQHPNTVRLFDFGTSKDGALFLVMEYLEGKPLGKAIKHDAPMAPKRIIHIATQVLEALAEAHAQGIVHRDLKPDNVFLTTVFGKQDFVKLLDFGIAKVTNSDEEGAGLTQTGTFVGSPRYMAPEQVRSHYITPQTDIYSLGAMMYEMLTGKPVFEASTPTGYLIAHVQEEPDPPVINGQAVGGPLVDFIMQCLQKAPNSRPQGAVGAIRTLAAIADRPLGPPSALPHVPPGHTGPHSASTLNAPPPPDVLPGGATDTGMHSEGTMGGPIPVEAIPSKRPALIALGLAALATIVAVVVIVTGGGGDGNAVPKERTPIADSSDPSLAEEGGQEGKTEGTPEGQEPAGGTVEADAATAKAEADAATAKAESDAGPSQDATAATADKADALVIAAEDVPPAEPEVKAEPKPEPLFVEIISEPNQVAVLRGDIELGMTPLKVYWEQGEKPPVLELQKNRYKPKKIQVLARDNGKQRLVKLTRKWGGSKTTGSGGAGGSTGSGGSGGKYKPL